MPAHSGATFAYVPNVLFAVWGTDYLSNDTPSVYQHYWSLGVEEQFYVVWPLLLLLAFALFRRSRKLLLLSVLAVTAASFVLGVWMTQWRQPLAFFLLPTRAWELGVGALVAIVVLRAPAFLSSVSRTATAWRAVAAVTEARQERDAERDVVRVGVRGRIPDDVLVSLTDDGVGVRHSVLDESQGAQGGDAHLVLVHFPVAVLLLLRLEVLDSLVAGGLDLLLILGSSIERRHETHQPERNARAPPARQAIGDPAQARQGQPRIRPRRPRP